MLCIAGALLGWQARGADGMGHVRTPSYVLLLMQQGGGRKKACTYAWQAQHIGMWAEAAWRSYNEWHGC